MVYCRNRILPGESLIWRHVPEIAGGWTQVPVRQLEPGAGKRIFELRGVLQPALSDFCISRVHLQSQIGGEHDRGVTRIGIKRIRHQVRCRAICRNPLSVTGRALGLLPIVVVEVYQIAV